MNKLKKILKVTGTVVGTCVGVCALGLSWLALGQIFVEQYHDPEHWANSIYNFSRYGWSLKTNDGWAA